ncbi:MAG: hypothetical protein KH353_02115 [Clostridium sp.]|nr:hypothetical protein [Clostridium sp.]
MKMKKLRQVLVLLLAICITLAGMPLSAAAGMMDMTNFNDGRIEVTKVPKGKSGGKVTIRMKIVNDEDSDMEDTTITLVGGTRYDDILNNVFEQDEDDEEDDSDDDDTIRDYNTQFPFEADSSTFEDKKVGTIKGHSSKTISMTFQLRRDLQPGYYQAFFDLNSSRDHEKTVGVNIWVSASDGSESDEETMDYDITIGENQSTPYGVYGEVLNFGVNLRNSGNRKMYDVRVSMQLDASAEKFPFDINDGNYDRKMGDMDVNQTVSVPYSMAVREDAKSGFYPITYKISYKETEDGDFEEPVDKILYVRVKGEDDDDLSADAGDNERTKARIIVESFSTEPAEVYAGTPFVLKIRMKNASSDVQASNILFTFSSEDTDKNPVFTTEEGSSAVVVNSLAPGQSADLELLFNSSPTAEQKSYTMSIKEKYDSPEFKNAEEEVKISIPVKQQPRLSTSTIEVMPESISVGSETNVMFGINNTGKVLLYNVTAVFEGDSIQKTDAYVGNIEPGKTGNVDTMISGIAPTTDDGKIKIIISYEDENGEVTEVEKEMSLLVTEPAEEPADMDAMADMEEMTPEEPSAFSKYKWVILLAVAAAAAAGTAVYRRQKAKKKAQEEEDIDDEIS